MEKEKRIDQLRGEMGKAVSKADKVLSKVTPDYQELRGLRIKGREIANEIKSKGADEGLVCRLYENIFKDCEITSRILSGEKEIELNYDKISGYLNELAKLVACGEGLAGEECPESKQVREEISKMKQRHEQCYTERELFHKKVALDNKLVKELLDELLKNFDPAKFSVLAGYNRGNLD